MFNLLRSDACRLVHGKMLWVVTVVLVAMAAMAAGMMHLVSSPEFLHATATNFEMTVAVGDPAADEGADPAAVDGKAAAPDAAEGGPAAGRGASLDEMADAAAEAGAAAVEVDDGDADDASSAYKAPELWDAVADNPAALSEADFEEVSREMRTLKSPADMLGDMAVSGGELAMVVSLVVALFFAQDFTTHFARNLVMDRRGRMRYYGGKLLLVGLLAAFFLLVNLLASAVAFAVAGFTYEMGNSVGEMALFLCLAWLVAFAYGCATAVVVWATRSAGAGVAWALVVASGIAGSLGGQLLLLMGKVVPWAGAAVPWLLSSCMQVLGNNASALLSTSAAEPLAMAPLAVQVVLTGLAWAALCAGLALGVLRKRDI